MSLRRSPDVPDVTVVVIAYNDMDNLSTAVRSVVHQTLHNLEIIVVNDASTDDTGRVADRLAAEDERVRAVHLTTNSGGCSRPRNVGLDLARGPFVMFLDSDDVYDRHACKNLLLEAERSGSDVVIGRCVRIIVGRDKVVPWAASIHPARATFAGIRDNPSLFLDPLSTNKIYRRAFLNDANIRFPEGVHYEDSLFTTKVYCMATSISVIPNVVYYWNVVPDAEVKSITQRRFEFENFRDRIEVHRMMDAYLRAHGSADLVTFKNFKFVRHDLALYLNDLPARDPDYQRRFTELAADYLSTVSDETMKLLDPVERICVWMLRHQDIEQTLKAVDYLRHGFKLSTELVKLDGRVYWTSQYLDTEQGRAAMDVTDVGLHRLPFNQQSVFNQVTSASIDGGHLRLEGRLLNQFRQIAPSDELRLKASFKNRGEPGRRKFTVAGVRNEGRYIYYRVDIDLARAVGTLDQDVSAWDFRLHIRWNGIENVAPFSIDPAQVIGQPVKLRARFNRTATGTLVPFVTTKGNLAFEQGPDDGVSEVIRRAHVRTIRVRKAVSRRLDRAFSGSTAKPRFYRMMQRLPVISGLTVFESHMGKQYSDNPKYVYEAACELGLTKLGVTPVWSYTGRPTGFPSKSRLVRRNSWRYYYLMARAQYWVDNQGFPRVFTKRPETSYLQTWHGTPLKAMGGDEPGLAALSPKARRAHDKMIERWDYLVAPSEYFVHTFARAYNYDGNFLRDGYPRNDLLVNRAQDDAYVKALKEKLGLPLDRMIVLFAPTFRDRRHRPKEPFELPFDLRVVGKELSGDVFFLLRAHYLDQFRMPSRHKTYARNLTDYDDMTELLLVADVLVTDYSSAMFDYANTGRPMVFYTHDYQEYVRERGTYFELERVAPGPMVTTTAGLIDALVEQVRKCAVPEEYVVAYDKFRDQFCEYEDGTAARTVAKEFFRAR